ncbi:hypothetical protein T459_26665 [Capsicum annuum]|uniref:Reverse transcriptase zinc-binding domain-containing protein n=1 Tax=Capsicum annuum TaxID=4072 RepID=A0A2G2YPL5_CAPAN|nr:hypothetical protein T459_26665 [Capsicum annuum]
MAKWGFTTDPQCVLFKQDPESIHHLFFKCPGQYGVSYWFEVWRRMKGKKAKEQREAMKDLEQSIHIVKAPAALNKRAITYTACQGPGSTKAVRGKSHGGMIILFPILLCS